jgi:hypothetical protein
MVKGVRGWVAVAVVLLATGCGSPASPVVSQSGQEQAGPEGAGPDSRTGEWIRLPAAPLSARHEAGGAWVAGRFIVLGGRSTSACPPTASCAGPDRPAQREGAGYDPATGRWTRIADAPVPLAVSSVAVAGGQIYVLTADQGRADSPVTFLSYDPERDAWATHPNPPEEGALVAVGSSVVVVPGSDEQGTTSDAVFDPDAGTWKVLPDDPLGPSFDREAVAVDGELLLAAKDLVRNPGAERPALVRLARLDADRSRWTTLPDSEIIGWGPVTVGGRVVWPGTGSADGGDIGNWGRSYSEGGIFSPASGSWQSLPRLRWNLELEHFAATVVGDRVLIGGHLLDPATLRSTRVPPLPGGRRMAPAVIGGPDTVLVWGGATEENRPENLATGYLLRPGPAS